MDTIGQRLSYIRKNLLKLNQKSFSQLLEISQGALSDVENGNRGLSMESLIRLYKYSKEDKSFSFDWLLLGIGKPSIINIPITTDDEQELLDSYKKLDTRGRHIVHATIYQELDRINSFNKNT